MEVSKGIHFFSGRGGSSNTYLIDQEILVDPGLDEFSGNLAKAIKAEDHDIKKIKIIIDTHGHYDHASANIFFKKLSGAKLCAHKNDAEKIETGKGSCFEFFSQSPVVSKIDKFLEDGETIKTENHTFKVIHTPGHTSGSICLYEENNKILVSGDTLFAEGFGRTDLESGSEKELKASLKKIAGIKIKLLLPGHGEIFKGKFVL
jgi:glyoxylase-like metal-dependent hydrolase (beta-lactamase superfamily II)